MVDKLTLWTDFWYNQEPKREKIHLPFANAFQQIWHQTDRSSEQKHHRSVQKMWSKFHFGEKWWSVGFVSLESGVYKDGRYKDVPFYQRWLFRIWHRCDLNVTFLGENETKLKNTHLHLRDRYCGDVNFSNLVCFLIEIGSIVRNLDVVVLQRIKTLNVFSCFRRRNIRTLIPKRSQHGRKECEICLRGLKII